MQAAGTSVAVGSSKVVEVIMAAGRQGIFDGADRGCDAEQQWGNEL